MFRCRLLPLAGLLLAIGCTWPVRQRTDQTVCRIANQPYDIGPANSRPTSASPLVDKPTNDSAPSNLPPSQQASAKAPASQPANVGSALGGQMDVPNAPQRHELRFVNNQLQAASETRCDRTSAAWLESPTGPRPGGTSAEQGVVEKVAWSQSAVESEKRFSVPGLRIPRRMPGSETPAIKLPATEDGIDELYPALQPLPDEPRMLPGPDGRPYSLSDLQRIAAANSPALRQAVARVNEARGKVIQARTYANPNASYFLDPNANNTSSGVQGMGIEQVIKTAGKQKLSAAAAQKDYENAQLALRAARNDLATRVRQAYFALLVDKETLAVTRAVARFTDEIYQLSTQLLEGGTTADYEPTALRAQANTTRLAYQQAIVTYMYDWNALVAAIGLHQLPLTEVAGRIDRFIPYYDYDQVRAYVLRNHTDILTALNLVPQARYNLKLAQVTAIPDLDVAYRYGKDLTAFPFGSYSQFLLSMPLPVWDQNKGNIIAAQSALVRATEEQHNSELDLTNRLADAYTNYQNNLYAVDYYRRYILPDLVRYYRGVYQRRPLEPDAVNVGDLAFAQQNLSQNVMAYLGVLGNLWQSVVGVADFLQTDDLFQMASPRPLPELPDFDEVSRWACGHSHVAAKCGVNVAPTLRGGVFQSPVATDTPSRSAGATAAANNRRTEER
jgi:cobalt-zinc-cadmium efflux system outer membrane protein